MCLTTTQILRAQVGMNHQRIPSKQQQKSKINHWNNKKEKRETIGKPKTGSYGRTAENKDAMRIGIEEIVVIELMMLFLLAVALSCLIVPCYHLLVVVERKIESVIGEGYSWLGCCTSLKIGVCSDLVYLGPCIHSRCRLFAANFSACRDAHFSHSHYDWCPCSMVVLKGERSPSSWADRWRACSISSPGAFIQWILDINCRTCCTRLSTCEWSASSDFKTSCWYTCLHSPSSSLCILFIIN